MEAESHRIEQLNQSLKEEGTALLRQLFPGEKIDAVIHDDVLIVLTDTPLPPPSYTSLLPQGSDGEDITLRKLKSQHPELSFAKGILFSMLLSLQGQVLRVETIETHPLRRKAGITTRFLELLMQLGRENGARFLEGEHSDSDIAEFFIRRGACLQIELKKELRRQVRGDAWPSFEKLPLSAETIFL